MATEVSVPAFLESRKYMQAFHAAGNNDLQPSYLPSGQEDATVVGFELKYRKKKDYDIIIDAHIHFAETQHDVPGDPPLPARAWSIKTHDHARFANLIPISMKIVALPSATPYDIRDVIERSIEESVEKLNAWWNQKETEHLRARYVGSLFMYHPGKFKIYSSVNSSKIWYQKSDAEKKLKSGKPLGTFLHEEGGDSETRHLSVRTTVRILRPVSDRRCTVQ